jgi:hypothetical protein
MASPAALGLRPRFARVVVAWSAVQPRPGAPPDWDAPGTGGFSVRAQLRALRLARARAGGGFEPVVTFFSTPAWAAAPPHGCLPPGGGNVNARAPGPAALPAYRALVESFLALARAERVPVRYLSAWNEPNSGLFLAPQRARCATDSPSLAAAEYAPLARALRAALAASPGDRRVLVGEASSPYAPRPRISAVSELIADLPRDVLCAGPIWAQHQYAGDADGVAAAERALAARGACRQRIWVTETGAGAPTPGKPRPPDPDALRAGCRGMASLLDRWYRDRDVATAFQYTLRDDANFPVGLAPPGGGAPYPAYELWRAWGARRDDSAPPPPLPPGCR